MSAKRIRTGREYFFWMIGVIYGVLALPFLLLFGIGMLWMVLSTEADQRIVEYEYLTAIIWTGILVPLFFFVRSVLGKRQTLKKLTSSLKQGNYFDPNAENEMYHEGEGKYLGIDIRNGTVLYIHRIRKGQVDVIGMNLGDWTQRELEGNILRLYTKFPELPRIEFSTPWAQRWYDTLGAMEHKRYEHSQRFSEYVNSHVEQLERDNKVQISKLA